MHPSLAIAVRAAQAAGDYIIRNMDAAPHIALEEKSHNDFVTQIDRQAEAIIVEALQETFPAHRILAEESGTHAGSEQAEGEAEGEQTKAEQDKAEQDKAVLDKAEQDTADVPEWIIDPLDGTTNYLHGFPQFAVSIAMREKGRLELGVVYDPMRQELFSASRGSGAFLNRRRIRVSSRRTLHGALLGTGLPFTQSEEQIEQSLRSVRAFMPHAAGIRRAGAAALDLAWLACGRLDGFWEYRLKPWDIAAGVLLIREAGGMVCDTDGGEDFMRSGNVLAANPRLLKQMLGKLYDA